MHFGTEPFIGFDLRLSAPVAASDTIFACPAVKNWMSCPLLWNSDGALLEQLFKKQDLYFAQLMYCCFLVKFIIFFLAVSFAIFVNVDKMKFI